MLNDSKKISCYNGTVLVILLTRDLFGGVKDVDLIVMRQKLDAQGQDQGKIAINFGWQVRHFDAYVTFYARTLVSTTSVTRLLAIGFPSQRGPKYSHWTVHYCHHAMLCQSSGSWRPAMPGMSHIFTRCEPITPVEAMDPWHSLLHVFVTLLTACLLRPCWVPAKYSMFPRSCGLYHHRN